MMTFPLPPGPDDQGQPPPDPLYGPPIEAYRPPPPDQLYPPPGQAYPPAPGQAYFPSNPAYPAQEPLYRAPDQAYPVPAYQTGYGYAGYQPYRPTDGLAVASLVVSCVAVPGLCAYGIGLIAGIVGAILGHASRRRIARTGASGGGMALAGIIVGWIAAAIGAVLIVIVVVVLITQNESI